MDTMELWKQTAFETMYDGLAQFKKTQYSRSDWVREMRLQHLRLGRPVSYKITGFESLDPKLLGLRVSPEMGWGVNVSVTYENGQDEVQLDYWKNSDGSFALLGVSLG